MVPYRTRRTSALGMFSSAGFSLVQNKIVTKLVIIVVHQNSICQTRT